MLKFMTKTRMTLFLSILVFHATTTISYTSEFRKLRVSENHRYLKFEDGEPFFYLGDTAWQLIHRLNRNEANLYLSNRAEKGFTVIQTVILAQLTLLSARQRTPKLKPIENV